MCADVTSGCDVCRYTGHEYDSEFIAVLRQECHKYIKREKRATLGARPLHSFTLRMHAI